VTYELARSRVVQYSTELILVVGLARRLARRFGISQWPALLPRDLAAVRLVRLEALRLPSEPLRRGLASTPAASLVRPLGIRGIFKPFWRASSRCRVKR
jgi:hypothetical protein